jgi:hypothetical protein
VIGLGLGFGFFLCFSSICKIAPFRVCCRD